MRRTGRFERRTHETDISAKVVLEGTGKSNISTGIGFFDHMLELFCAHGSFDIELECHGDLHVDGHHTVEDTGIVLGKAFSEALGDRKGIKRYGSMTLPMDEALAMVSLDISGRPYLNYDVPVLAERVGDFDTQLVEEFFRAFCVHSGITLHIRVIYGKNIHHIIEAIFKAFGRALKEAVLIERDSEQIPSTKGILD